MSREKLSLAVSDTVNLKYHWCMRVFKQQTCHAFKTFKQHHQIKISFERKLKVRNRSDALGKVIKKLAITLK